MCGRLCWLLCVAIPLRADSVLLCSCLPRRLACFQNTNRKASRHAPIMSQPWLNFGCVSSQRCEQNCYALGYKTRPGGQTWPDSQMDSWSVTWICSETLVTALCLLWRESSTPWWILWRLPSVWGKNDFAVFKVQAITRTQTFKWVGLSYLAKTQGGRNAVSTCICVPGFLQGFCHGKNEYLKKLWLCHCHFYIQKRSLFPLCYTSLFSYCNVWFFYDCLCRLNMNG